MRNSSKVWIGILAVLLLICVGGLIWMHARQRVASNVPRDFVDDGGMGASTRDAENASEQTPNSPPGQLTIHVDKPGPKLDSTMYGLTLEEINHSLDGGLYGELLQNRDMSEHVMTIRRQAARQIPVQVPAAWSLIKDDAVRASMTLDMSEAIPRIGAHASMKLAIESIAEGQRAGVANWGYWGIPVKNGWEYQASFYAKAGTDFSGPLTVSIESNDGRTTFARAVVDKVDAAWQRYEVKLKTGTVEGSTANRFVISAASKGTLWLAQASLFPPTFHDRPNGNRIDLMEKLADLRPGYVLFPGGDFMIGVVERTRFHWKNAIGPELLRMGQQTRWEWSSNGFGLLEFLVTCEELKAQPVLALYAGTSVGQRIEAGSALQPFVQDALDEIEYVVGDTSTTWGAKRAADGHPEPFNLQYVQVGNNEELFGKATYDARFTQFYDAIKQKYPALKIIGWMDLATTRTPEVIHESWYRTARELMTSSAHYDTVPRGGARYKTEFTATEGDPTKTLYAALADTAWLMGVEHNADAVAMAHTAPLFINVNVGAQQLGADLIGYDALHSFGSPSYYAQRMWNQNRGDIALPVDVTPQVVTTSDDAAPHGAIGVGSWGSDVEYKDIKVTSPDGTVFYQSDFTKGRDGWRIGVGAWNVKDGSLRQTSTLIDCTAIVGDPHWTDYTLTLKARKNRGVEGFLIIFHAADSGNLLWCNLGGWNNLRMGIEQTQDGAKAPVGDGSAGRIDAGKWYDIKVEVMGDDIVCYLDDAPVLNGRERARPAPAAAMFATASRDNATGELILKVVNVLPVPQSVHIDLKGVNSVEELATAEVLSGDAGDVNTIESPEKIVPRRMTDHIPGLNFIHQFPRYSLSILRIKPSR